MNIQLSHGGINLDRLIESRLLIQANSGGGKSTLIRYICEQTHSAIQQIIFDREGEFATLREKFPYLLVGSDGDIAADLRSAKLLAKKVMELELSVIIDLSEMTPANQKEYVHLYLESMMHLPRPFWKDCLVIIDEAHVFAPESGKGQSVATEDVALLLSAGRKRGYCGIMATQRLAKLSKDVAAECLNKLIGRTSNEDLKRAGEELDFDKKGARELRKLSPGDFWGYGPAISPDPIAVRASKGVKTAPPKRGTNRAPAPAAQGVIKKVLAELSDLPAVAAQEERTVADLKREIADLRRLTATPIIETVVSDRSAHAERHIGKLITSVSDQLNKVSYTVQKQIIAASKNISEAAQRLEKLSEDAFPLTVDFPPYAADVALAPFKVTREFVTSGRQMSKTLTAAQTMADYPLAHGGPEKKIATAIHQLNRLGVDPVRKDIAAFFSGYSIGGHYNNTLSKMRKAGLLEYPQPDYVALTVNGMEVADVSAPIKSLDEFHHSWLQKLPGPEARILKFILDHHPAVWTPERVAEETGYTVGGHFNNVLGRLRSLGVVPKRGLLGATDVLFPPGLH